MSRLVSSSSLNKTSFCCLKKVTPYHHLVAWRCRGPGRRELRSQFHTRVRWSTVKISHFFLKGKKLASTFKKLNTSERRPSRFKGFLASFPGRFALIQDWGYCKRKGSRLSQLWLNMHIMVISFNLIAATQLLSLPDLSVFLNFTSAGKSCTSCVVSWDLEDSQHGAVRQPRTPLGARWCSSDRARPSRCAPLTVCSPR